MSRPTTSSAFETPRRRTADRNNRIGKKEERRDIWSNLLRQTREAQARSRTGNSQGLVTRNLVVCGGAPDEQRHFVQSLARPPPTASAPNRNRDQKPQKPKGGLVLSNRYAYGYGYLTLFSANQQGGGSAVGGLGQESEEMARVEVHTVPEAEEGYRRVLNGLLVPEEKESEGEEHEDADGTVKGEGDGRGKGRPAVCLLLSWKEPWKFMRHLRAWLQLLASSLREEGHFHEDPLDVLKEHRIPLTVVIQHTEAQIALERDSWREEKFDYVSQLIRTAILPLSAALLYMPSTAPPQQPGSALTESQKVVYSSLGLDLGPLSPPPASGAASAKREDLEPRHNVVDRMAICVPHGWDSLGKIRLLSETFSPEEMLESWLSDLSQPQQPPFRIKPQESTSPPVEQPPTADAGAGGEEVFGSSHASSPSPPASTQQTPAIQSAIAQYESEVTDPNAHKAPLAPAITTTTRREQDFLSEMKRELDTLATQDADRSNNKTRTTAGNSTLTNTGGSGNTTRRLDSGSGSGALDDLGDVSFNVGGVSYNTVSAEAAIQNLRRPQQGQDTAAGASPAGSRGGTPRPREREVSGTPASSGAKGNKAGEADVPVADLEKYFASLMKKGGGGGGSSASTPTKPH
ncbi:hypothetical protein MBLNU230_g6801t1 [Neophaeotheca triangularis]